MSHATVFRNLKFDSFGLRNICRRHSNTLFGCVLTRCQQLNEVPPMDPLHRHEKTNTVASIPSLCTHAPAAALTRHPNHSKLIDKIWNITRK